MSVSHDAIGQTDEGLDDLERYRRELTGYCYRMLGSAFEAEDAVQETMVRAWRGWDSFEGRSQVRSWLYRIATNVCLDMLRGRQRRARPMELVESGTRRELHRRPAARRRTWVTPIPDAKVVPEDGDPAEVAAARETIRLAFVTALQHLPARQRAALILCEVLKWQATEAAELLDTSVASINSALQRARATLAERQRRRRRASASAPTGDQEALVARYVDAFERYDVQALVAMLHDDVVQSMPPYEHWLAGVEHVGRWFVGPGAGCEGSRVLVTAGQRLRRLRAVPRRPEGRLDAVVAVRPRVVRRPDRRPSTTSSTRRCSPTSGCPSTSTSPQRSSRPTRSSLGRDSRIEHPARRAASCQRASRCTTTRSTRPQSDSGQLPSSTPSLTRTTLAWSSPGHTPGMTAVTSGTHRRR